MRKGGDRSFDGGWFRDLVDKARTGLILRTFKIGRAAGYTLCTSPAIGTWAELNARDDIKAVPGALGIVTDVGTWGSNWVVQSGVWVPDGPISGLGTPEGVIAAPVGTEYLRHDAATMAQARYFKAFGSGNTGWTTDVQGAMVDVVDPTRDCGAVLDGVTVCTAQIQAAVALAKKAALAGFSYGMGGKIRPRVGVLVSGPVTWSRWVSLEGPGALGSFVWRSDYSSRVIDGVPTPGVDAFITMPDDGSGQNGIIGQQKFHNVALDGRRSTLASIYGGALATHVRHGLYFPEPVDGTDRVSAVGDFHVMNFPGAGWFVEKNDQVRGGNVKLTGNRQGLRFHKLKDGKIDQIGLGQNGDGGSEREDELAMNELIDCASLKIGKADIWCSAAAMAKPLLLIKSCAKTVIGEGEIEGMVVIEGDNDNPNSKAYRQVLANILQSINFKVSEDHHAAYVAKGRTANVLTGEGYVGHVKVLDAHGGKIPACTFSYKLGQPQDGEGDRIQYLEATPPVAVWFGTKVPVEDEHYSDHLKTCGDLDVTGVSFAWWEGKDSPGGVRSRTVYAFKDHISNRPHHLKGLRLGHVILRPTGTGQEDEIPLAGTEGQRTYTTEYDKGLLYLRLDPNWASGNWAAMRKLRDEDTPGLGYATFIVPDWSAQAPAGSTFYMVYKQ